MHCCPFFILSSARLLWACPRSDRWQCAPAADVAVACSSFLQLTAAHTQCVSCESTPSQSARHRTRDEASATADAGPVTEFSIRLKLRLASLQCPAAVVAADAFFFFSAAMMPAARCHCDVASATSGVARASAQSPRRCTRGASLPGRGRCLPPAWVPHRRHRMGASPAGLSLVAPLQMAL